MVSRCLGQTTGLGPPVLIVNGPVIVLDRRMIIDNSFEPAITGELPEEPAVEPLQ